MKLIIGLGNVGEKYYKTRHNIGFLMIDKIILNLNVELNVTKFNGDFFKGKLDGNDVIIAKPTTFMNYSGDFVKAIVDFYKIPIEDIIVFYDDKDIEFGKIKISRNFSGGTHNGILDIINKLNSNKFGFVRVGIKSDRINNMTLKNFVLEDFNDEEISKLKPIFDCGYDIFYDSIKFSFLHLMNKYN